MRARLTFVAVRGLGWVAAIDVSKRKGEGEGGHTNRAPSSPYMRLMQLAARQRRSPCRWKRKGPVCWLNGVEKRWLASKKKMRVRQHRVVGEADMGHTVRGTSGGQAMHTELGEKKTTPIRTPTKRASSSLCCACAANMGAGGCETCDGICFDFWASFVWGTWC